jgi:hypothetical protein
MYKNDNSSQGTKKLKKLSRKAEWVLFFTIFIPLFVGLIWIIFSYGDVDSYLFWIVGIIEVFLAYITMTLRRKEFFLVIFVPSILFPYFVHHGFQLPINMVWMIYILSGATIGIISLLKPRKTIIISKTPDVPFLIPQYLPPEYKEAERNIRKKKNNRIMELIFSNDEDEHLVWLLESKNPISIDKPKTKTESIQKTINGVTVYSDLEILENTSKQKDNTRFIESTWFHNDVYFNLRSDGISLDEAEKIITSMIH